MTEKAFMNEKIVFLLNSPYPNYTGGRETWLNNIANRLAERYEVVVISEDHINKNSPASHWIIDPRITLIQVKSLLSYRCTNWILRSYLNYYHCFSGARMMRKALLKQIGKDQRVFIVAMDTVFMPLVFRGIKRAYPNTVTIISSRGPHAEIYGTYWPLKKEKVLKLEKENLREADKIWSNGIDTQALLLKKGFQSKVIYNGVDCTAIMSAELAPHAQIKAAKGIKIVTIGTLLDLKGYPTMLAAVKEILELAPELDVDLFAFGKGNPERYLKMSKAYGVEKHVHFLGEEKRAPFYAKQADVLLALGTSEGSGMSMAALEMLATGVPVIATDIPCYRQLITDGENGFLVPEGDCQALARTILAVYRRPLNIAIDTRKKAQERIMDYDWSHVERLVLNELESL